MFGGYLAHLNSYSLDVFTKNMRDAWRNLWERDLGDPVVEDLQKALGDPPPGHYINVLLSLEDVLLVREWDRRRGYTVIPREGMVDLLRWLVDPASGCFVTLWSENSSAVAGEIMEQLMPMLKGPAAHTPPVSARAFFSLGCLSMQAMLCPCSLLFNPSPHPPHTHTHRTPPLTQLSLDHMFIRDDGKRKEKRLEYFNRDRKTMLLIDHNAVSEELNPGNTVLVQGKSSMGESAQDTTCASIKALVSSIRDDASGTGQVNIPRSLAKLREEATGQGFPSDASGLFAYLSKAAAEESEMELVRRNSGLGGLLRRGAAESPLLRSKASTLEMAASKTFKDPGAELGEESLLVRKMRETSRKAFGR